MSTPPQRRHDQEGPVHQPEGGRVVHWVATSSSFKVGAKLLGAIVAFSGLYPLAVGVVLGLGWGRQQAKRAVGITPDRWIRRNFAEAKGPRFWVPMIPILWLAAATLTVIPGIGMGLGAVGAVGGTAYARRHAKESIEREQQKAAGVRYGSLGSDDRGLDSGRGQELGRDVGDERGQAPAGDGAIVREVLDTVGVADDDLWSRGVTERQHGGDAQRQLNAARRGYLELEARLGTERVRMLFGGPVDRVIWGETGLAEDAQFVVAQVVDRAANGRNVPFVFEYGQNGRDATVRIKPAMGAMMGCARLAMDQLPGNPYQEVSPHAARRSFADDDVASWSAFVGGIVAVNQAIDMASRPPRADPSLGVA